MPGVEALISHMAKYYSDRHIAEDLNTVLALCEDDAARRACRAYAKARRRSPGFDPSRFLRNADKGTLQSNHHAIPSETLQAIHAAAAGPTGDGRKCAAPECGKSIEHLRRNARTCDSKCRQRLRRARALVTLSGPVIAPEGDHLGAGENEK